MADEVRRELIAAITQQSPKKIKGIKPCGKLTPEQAIEVYSKGYMARLTEALGETYEVVWWCLGDEGFLKIAREYIEKNPSTFYNLANYGETFPRFLSKWDKDLPFLEDLARFEWEFARLFHGPEDGTISDGDWQKFSTLKNPRIRLGQQIRLFDFEYSIPAIWRSYKKAVDQNEFEKPMWNKSQAFAIYKRNHNLFLKDLSRGQYLFLKYLNDGQSFCDALDFLQDENILIDEAEMTGLFAFLREQNLVAQMGG